MQIYTAWTELKRPLFARLPGFYGGFTENADADLVTKPVDDLLVELKAKLDDLDRQLDPMRCDAEWLPVLAAMAGFTGQYFNPKWPEVVRRSLVRDGFTKIWPNKGSRGVLDLVLGYFGYDYKIWAGSPLLAGTMVAGDVVGLEPWTFYLQVGTRYLRDSVEFRTMDEIRRLFSPVYCKSRVVYKRFSAGLSVAGDPVF